MTTDNAGQMPEKVYLLSLQVAIETRTPTGPLPTSTPDRIIILGPDDYGPVIGKLARSVNRVLPGDEARDRDALLNRIEDAAYGREPSGLLGSSTEAAHWRAAFERLLARIQRDLPGDGSELPQPDDEFWARQLDGLVAYADELYRETEGGA